MRASAAYGVVAGLAMGILGELNSPFAWAAFWSFQTAMLVTYSIITWRRTQMIWMTVTGVHAALISAVLVPASFVGYTLANLPSPWNVVFLVNAAVPFLLRIVIRFTEREKLERWKQHQRDLSVVDMFRFRQIPDLR